MADSEMNIYCYNCESPVSDDHVAIADEDGDRATTQHGRRQRKENHELIRSELYLLELRSAEPVE